MAWEKGSFGRAELEEHLGLTGGKSDYAEGSSTGVKSNALLGEGYLSKDDYKRLLGNKDLKQAFVNAGGSPDSWETINDVDAAIDYLTKEEDTPADKEVETFTEFDPKEMEMSPEYAHARARAGQFREDRISGRSAAEVFGGESTNFLEDYKMRLGEKLENGNYKPNPKYDEG